MLIGKSWKVESDSSNVILYQKSVMTKKDTGERYDHWGVHGYFATVKNALREMINQSIRDTDLVDMKTLVAKIEELHQAVDRLPMALQGATEPSNLEDGVFPPAEEE